MRRKWIVQIHEAGAPPTTLLYARVGQASHRRMRLIDDAHLPMILCSASFCPDQDNPTKGYPPLDRISRKGCSNL